MEIYALLVFVDHILFGTLGGIFAFLLSNSIDAEGRESAALATWFVGLWLCVFLVLASVELGSYLNSINPDRENFVRSSPLIGSAIVFVSVSWWKLRKLKKSNK